MRTMTVSAFFALIFLSNIPTLRAQQATILPPREMTAIEMAQDSTVFLEVSYSTKKEVIQRLRKRKKFRHIETALNWWIAYEPVNDTARIMLAEIYESQNFFQEACDIYERLIYLNPEKKEYLAKVITLFTKQRFYTIAIKYCDRYLEKNPGHLPVMEKKAELLDKEKKFYRAAAAYADIVTEAPHRDDMKLKWADALSKNKDYETAITVYEELLQSSPDNANYKRGMAITLFYAGKLQESEKLIKEVLMFDSRDYDLIEVYCNILTKQQRYNHAINYYYRLLQSDPLDVKIKWRIAQIYAWKGEYYVALSLYEQLLRTINVPQEILRERAQVLGWAHKSPESLEAYQHLISSNPDDSLIKIEATAKQALYNHRYQSSIEHHNKLVALEKNNWDAQLQLAQLYSKFEQWSDGRRHYQDIIAAMPSFDRVHKALNKLELNSKRPQVTTAINYQHAHSQDRSAERKQDYELYRSNTMFSLPPYSATTVAAGYQFDRYHFDEASDRSINRIMLATTYNQQPWYWLEGSYAYASMPHDMDAGQEYQLAGNVRLADIHTFTIHGDRSSHFNNADAFTAGIQRNSFGLTYAATINRNLTFNADYTGYTFSDSLKNKQKELDVQLTFATFFKRTGFDLFLNLNNLNSEQVSTTNKTLVYFAPEKFTTINIGLNWTEYLKGYDFAWGDKKTYYNLGYRFTVEPQARFAHRISGGLHIDLSTRATLNLTGEIMRIDSRTLSRQALIEAQLHL